MVYEDRTRTLWIGMGGDGLARLTDDRFTVYARREGLAADTTWCGLEGLDILHAHYALPHAVSGYLARSAARVDRGRPAVLVVRPPLGDR